MVFISAKSNNAEIKATL